MIDSPAQKIASPNAYLSLVFGLATLVVIPFISLLIAPCGFPLSLLSGILAISLGGKVKREAALAGNESSKMATAGIWTGWIGMAVNTVLMLIKLAMFVVIIIIPLLLIIHGGNKR
jgi:hypothetical protein